MVKLNKTRQPKPKNNMLSGNIRIIAGKHRGRKLPVIMSPGLRPTTDRIKETVFNWLMPYVHASHCLDCYAGAGSLGFEALSRGASELTLLELDKKVAQQLRENKIRLNADNVKVIEVNCLDYLRNNLAKQQDIVFVDPPFRQGLLKETIELLTHGWVAELSLIYLEMESNLSEINIPNNWLLLKEKVSGQVAYRLYQVQAQHK
jgi:16S rRNA (guanine966-N2)-methyltransferase